MSGKYRLLVTIAVAGMLLAFIPAYGAVIANNGVTVQTSYIAPFAYLTNETSSVPASAAIVNQYGTEANVSLTGTWQLSNTSQLRNIDGFIAQSLSRNVNADTYLEVTSITGTSNLSQLKVFLNQSNAPGQLEAEYSNGAIDQYNTPVSLAQPAPLNLSISFSPHTTSSKLIQYYHVYMSLNVLTYAGQHGNSAHIEETINISITEQIF